VSIFRTPEVILFSENLPRAVAFYSSLGFTETFRVPTEGEPIHVDLALDGYKIGIASVASTRDDHGLDPVPKGQRAAVILLDRRYRRRLRQTHRGRSPPRRRPRTSGSGVC
jgi:glyoxylase I family protein